MDKTGSYVNVQKKDRQANEDWFLYLIFKELFNSH